MQLRTLTRRRTANLAHAVAVTLTHPINPAHTAGRIVSRMPNSSLCTKATPPRIGTHKYARTQSRRGEEKRGKENDG